MNPRNENRSTKWPSRLWNDIGIAARGSADERKLEQLGDFRILREIARGGMGIVYEAEQESLGRRVALKVMMTNPLSRERRFRRFQREARAAARLHHTNIVPVYGVGEHEGHCYYVMQFIQGQSLDHVLDELRRLRRQGRSSSSLIGANPSSDASGRAAAIVNGLMTGRITGAAAQRDSNETPQGPPGQQSDEALAAGARGSQSGQRLRGSRTSADQQYWRSVARIGCEVAGALAYAHEQGTYHRDIKPSNLLLDAYGATWVADFGLAKISEDEDLTKEGDVLGTLRYMAPEQFDGVSDARSDIYSLGLTLYELLTLTPAFPAKRGSERIKNGVAGDPQRPRKTNPAIPRDLETIVLKAIASEPERRYQTAGALLDDLRRFLEDRPIQARRTSLLERCWRWGQRNPLLASLVGMVMILLITVAAVSSVSSWRLRAKHKTAVVNLIRAQRAERESRTAEREARRAEERQRAARELADKRLFDSLLATAEAKRRSGQQGQRFDALDAIDEASRLAKALEFGQEAELKLRNQAIAALALVDLRIDRQWPGFPPRNSLMRIGFDSHLQRYARLEPGNQIVVRRMNDNESLLQFEGLGDLLRRPYLRFSPNGEYLAALGFGRGVMRVQVWELQRPGQAILDVPAGGSPSSKALAFSPDSRRLAFTSPDGSIRLIDLESRAEQQRFALESTAEWLSFHPEGRQLATAIVPATSSLVWLCWTSTPAPSYGNFPTRRPCWPVRGVPMASDLPRPAKTAWSTSGA